MRRHLITLVLTTGTLVSTDATRLSTPTGNKDWAILPRRESGPASGLGVLDRRTWISRSPLEIESVKRNRKYRYTARDGDKHEDHDSDDDEEHNGHKHDDDEDDDPHHYQPPPQLSQPSNGGPQYTPTFTTSTSTPTSSMSTRTNLPSTVSSSTTPVATLPQPPPTGSNTGINDGDDPGRNSSTNPTDPKGNSGGGDKNNNDSNSKKTVKAAAISVGVVGGLLLLLILLLIWYWFVIRPKRRERLAGQHTLLPKNSDLESHVTMDLRNGPGSSSDGLSSHVMSTGTPGHVPAQGQHGVVVVESATRSLSIPPSPGVAQAEPYAAVSRASPTVNHSPFMEAYAAAAAHPAYGQDHARSYSPMKNPQGVIPPLFPSQGRPSPLQTDAFPTHVGCSAPTAMELDGRPPPPRYPDAIAASQAPGSSPTSPLPVSPLSVISPHLGPHALTTDDPQYHPRQYQGPQQPGYGDYGPSSLPEVVSPICQLGQTSASLPEYDESAEAARSGASNHNNLASQHHLQGGDEKQALSSQQPMPRY
ncbi:hypothetical protein F4782DRAFT_526111 [Xylaria castorea]|nr:hypothetical protein F4782DRAFT_526111 [Xylaria castorea]